MKLARKYAAVLRRQALSYPEAKEDFPWGEPVFKVRGRVFLFLSLDDDGLSFTVKLGDSSLQALVFPFASPTGYNLGQHGWVTASFGVDEEAPLELLQLWLDDSYRAVAPRLKRRGTPRR